MPLPPIETIREIGRKIILRDNYSIDYISGRKESGRLFLESAIGLERTAKRHPAQIRAHGGPFPTTTPTPSADAATAT